MKKYIEPDIKLCYFEAERITVNTGDQSANDFAMQSNLFGVGDGEQVTVTDSVKFADIKNLN